MWRAGARLGDVVGACGAGCFVAGGAGAHGAIRAIPVAWKRHRRVVGKELRCAFPLRYVMKSVLVDSTNEVFRKINFSGRRL